jgi:hypothetical protein
MYRNYSKECNLNNNLSGYFICKMDAFKNCDTLFLARSEQQASQNYETAVALNNMICEA